MAREQRKLAAILAADVVGYSRLMGRDESGTLARLRAHRKERLEPVLARYGGRLVKLTGDGALVEFASAVDALSAAIEFQQAVVDESRAHPETERIVFRIGLHLGDLIVDGDDLYGDGVNIAARLQSEAPGGGIIVSRTVHEAITGRLKATFDDLGNLALKNIDRAIQVFSVKWEASDWEGLATVPSAPLIGLAVPAAEAPLPLPDKPSIAVLPFENMSGDSGQEYFVDGLVEDIITALSRFRSIFVIARNASFTYKGRATDVRNVGRDLGVRYILQGSVRKTSNKVRIAGQLIDCETRALLWAERFDGSLEDVFDLQDQIASSVAGAIAPRIDEAETKRARQKPPGNLEAYDLFLRGMAKVHEYSGEGWKEAFRLFNRAIELDPDFAPPYAMLMRYYWVRKLAGRDADQEAEQDEVRRLAARVAQVGHDDPFALSWAGFSLAMVCREQDKGQALVDQALSLNPNLAACWQTSGSVRLAAGNHETAIQHLMRAFRLNPVGPEMVHIGITMAVAYLYQGNCDEAIRWANRVLIQTPNNPLGLLAAANANALAGNLDKARSIAANVMKMRPTWKASTLRETLVIHPGDMDKFLQGLRLSGFPE